MSVTVGQSRALREMAALLYDFLPGSGNPSWKGHVSFNTVTRDLGLDGYWQSGSKEPAIIALLERTLDKQPQKFEPLILAVVKHGMTYRNNRDNPITVEDVIALNHHLEGVGFKFPDLNDAALLTSLPRRGDGSTDPPRESSEKTSRMEPATTPLRAKMSKLCEPFYFLSNMDDRQAAGFELEKLLNELFTLSDLNPRSPFKVVGEQIDGSFALDFEIYLVEAKWWKEPVRADLLMVFREKIAGKSAFTRGMFLAINGFTDEALIAITRGKQPTFFLADGYDLTSVLEMHIDLKTVLRAKQRKLAEDGSVFTRYEGEPANG